MDPIKERMIREEKTGPTFSQWLVQVDIVCIQQLGLGRDDLPDWHWAEAHEDGLTPHEAFNAMHEDNFGDSFEAINGQFGVGA